MAARICWACAEAQFTHLRHKNAILATAIQVLQPSVEQVNVHAGAARALISQMTVLAQVGRSMLFQ